MKTTFTLSLFLCLMAFQSSIFGQEKSPDWTMNDVHGVEHSLYADYLDQGKTVLLSFGGVWSVWDSVWISSGVLQEFSTLYGGDGGAEVFYIDPTNSTLEDMYGTGNSGVNYDFVTGNTYPIFSTWENGGMDLGNFFIDAYEVTYFPTIRMICPDGTIYAEDYLVNDGPFYMDEQLNYGKLIEGGSDLIAERMTANCGTVFDGNRLEATVFRDRNDDCLYDAVDEEKLAFIKAEITGPNGTFLRAANDQGEFFSIMQQGDYEVRLIPPNYLWENCDGPKQYTFTDTDQIVTDELALSAVQNCYSPTISVSSPRLRRCFDSEIFIDYCNEGTEPAPNSYIVVQLGDFLEIVSASESYTIENNGILFTLGDLDVWECGKIKLNVYVDCDDTMLGDTTCFYAQISPHVCNADSLFWDGECQELVGAYDPNDKRAFPDFGESDYTTLPNENIKYQIRFQNTGTDTAFNVVIEDVISDQLDLASIRPGTSSHGYDFEITEERKIRFLFNNIMLPDSNVNLVGSNGFVTYYIDQLPDLSNGTKIENTAAIFFDFNEPVITNTTVHEVDDGIILSSNEVAEKRDFIISPNPANDHFTLILDDEFWLGGQLELFDIIGRKQMSQNIDSRLPSISTSTLENGVYLVRIKNQGSEVTKKVVIKK